MTEPFEHTIYRIPVDDDVEPDVVRTAIRGVVSRNGRLLMVYSPVNGDYKFPGGGTESNETHEQTLVREVKEETGEQIGGSLWLIGRVREYGEAMQPGASVFMMDSYYYGTVAALNAKGAQKLDSYESDLKFTPQWVTVEEAIRTNESLLADPERAPRWTRRETWVLRWLLRAASEPESQETDRL